MKLLGTEEIRKFSQAEDAKFFINQLEETINYRLVEKKAMMAGEVINCPIIPSSFTTSPVVTIKKGSSNGIAFPRLEGGKSFVISTDFDEQMSEAMNETRLVLGSNTEDGSFEPAPLASNAMFSLIAQAIGGKSTVLCQTEDKNASKQMHTETKAAIINEFLSLRKDKAMIYHCDGMIRYVAGDNYVYLPISELLATLEEELSTIFPNASYRSSTISHQYVSFTYVLNDKEIKEQIDNILAMGGIKGDYQPAVVFSTSNTGDSGVNLYPVLLGKRDEYLSVEDSKTLEHVGNASIERFRDNIRSLEALFRSSAEKIEKLAEIGLKHPANAYKNVAFKSNLPVACFADQADVFEETYGDMATALDLYFELTNQLFAYADKNSMNILRLTKLQNSLAQKFLTPERLEECDVDIVYIDMK